MRIYLTITALLLVCTSCSKEYDCEDIALVPAFVGFSPADLDTLLIKKFPANSNFQHPVDSFLLTTNSAQYSSFADTTIVYSLKSNETILPGADWQILIPALNRVIGISAIVSEKKTGRCNYGIFSMDKMACICNNPIYSIKKDNQLIQLSMADKNWNFIHISK